MSSSADFSGRPGAKLPLGATISLSYSTYIHNLPNVLRASWLWLLLVAALTGVSSWLQWTWMAGLIAASKGGVPPASAFQASRPAGLIVAANLDTLILVLAGVSIAVAWHRLIILHEPPGLSGGNVITKNVWRYIGIGIAIVVICVLPAAVIAVPFFLFAWSGAAQGQSPGLAMLLIPVIILLYLAGLAVMLRLSPLLPARAVDDLGLTFKQAWNGTRGNTWRILWGLVACMMPPMIVAQIAFLAVIGFPRPEMFVSGAFAGRMTVISTIMVVYYLLVLPIGIGFLSYVYRHFFQRV